MDNYVSILRITLLHLGQIYNCTCILLFSPTTTCTETHTHSIDPDLEISFAHTHTHTDRQTDHLEIVDGEHELREAGKLEEEEVAGFQQLTRVTQSVIWRRKRREVQLFVRRLNSRPAPPLAAEVAGAVAPNDIF